MAFVQRLHLGEDTGRSLSVLGTVLIATVVVGLIVTNVFTLAIACYLGFGVAMVFVWRERVRLGLSGEHSQSRLAFVIGALALSFGLVSGSMILTLPGLALVVVSGTWVMRENQRMRLEKADTGDNERERSQE
jgi:hypothetical protein